MKLSRGIRLVALFEGLKGALILLAGFGLLALGHRDLQDVADELVRRFHLNPARHYPRIFIEASGKTTDTQLWLLAGAALLYAVFRFVEAYGLWRERRWAGWFAAATGAIYVPLEIPPSYSEFLYCHRVSCPRHLATFVARPSRLAQSCIGGSLPAPVSHWRASAEQT